MDLADSPPTYSPPGTKMVKHDDANGSICLGATQSESQEHSYR